MRDADDPTNNRGLRCMGPFDGLGFLLYHLPALRLETGGGVLLLRLYSSFDFGVVAVKYDETGKVEECK